MKQGGADRRCLRKAARLRNQIAGPLWSLSDQVRQPLKQPASVGRGPIAGQQPQVGKQRPPQQLPLSQHVKRPASCGSKRTSNRQFAADVRMTELARRFDFDQPLTTAPQGDQKVRDDVGEPAVLVPAFPRAFVQQLKLDCV